MIQRLWTHRGAAGGRQLLWLAASVLALLAFLASPFPGLVAVRWMAGARFAGAILGPGTTALLLLALLMAAFVPVGLASAAWVRGRAVIEHASRAATAHLQAMLLGFAACAAGGLLASTVDQAPWLPWALAGAPGVIVGALLLPMRRPPSATPAGGVMRLCVITFFLAGLVLVLAVLLLAPVRTQVSTGLPSAAAGAHVDAAARRGSSPSAPAAASVPAAVARAPTGHVEAAEPASPPSVSARLAALNPLALPAGRRAAVRLTVDEVQQLLRFVLRRIDAKAHVRVAPDPSRRALAWSASVRVPVRWRPYLNLHGAIALRLRDGVPVFHTCSLQAGALALPEWSCRNLLAGWYRAPRAVASASAATGSGAPGARTTAANVAGIGMLDALTVDARGAAVVYRRLALQEDGRRALQHLLGPGDVVVAAVDAQLLNLQRNTAHLQASGDRFRDALQLAFRMAQVRSRVSDPVAENQGAVLALAMVFGDPDVALAAGLPRDPSVAALGQRIGPLHLWGRVDWAQHFLLSAAFAQVATARVSDVVGLVKEQMDANGGSGFSFTDLLADRAGTAFGRRLGAGADEALRVQGGVVDDWRLGDIAPSPNGLPEGMQAAEFAARYGAVGSPEYRRVEAEIARRMGTARLLTQ